MDLDAIIARHGVAVQSVVTDHPHDPPFSYTVGRHLRGQPELIAFGGAPAQAGSLLNELHRDHGAARVHAGAELSVAQFHGHRVRLRPARPEWAAMYGLAAFHHARAHPADVPFLQVVIPDPEGRLPGEHGRPARCACCPDLSHPERPYVLPLDSTDLYDILHGVEARPPSAIEVCVPVRVHGHDVGRVERLVAEDLGGGLVRLLHPPLIADWTTAGATLHLDQQPDPCGAPVASTEASTSPDVHLTWMWAPTAFHDSGGGDRIDRALDRLCSLPGVTMTLDTSWLAVAAPSRSSHQARAAVRRLVRDGLAREAEPFSRPSRVCTDPGCCGPSPLGGR